MVKQFDTGSKAVYSLLIVFYLFYAFLLLSDKEQTWVTKVRTTL